MKRFWAGVAVVLTAVLFAAPAQGFVYEDPWQSTGEVVTWTGPSKGPAGYVAIICRTDEATPKFWASQMPLPLSGSWEIGRSTTTVVFNPGLPYYEYAGTITCEGRVISKNGQRDLGPTTPRFFPNLGPVTPGPLPPGSVSVP